MIATLSFSNTRFLQAFALQRERKEDISRARCQFSARQAQARRLDASPRRAYAEIEQMRYFLA
jgi:hypothetical protein